MSRVQGRITDFGGSRLRGLSPELTVIPSGPATYEGQMLATWPIPPTLGTVEDFDFTIVSSDEMSPPRPYTFRIRWLDSAGGMAADDRWENVWVPRGTFSVSDLIGQQQVSSTQAFWQPTEPDPFPLYAFWVNTITGDVKQRTA